MEKDIVVRIEELMDLFDDDEVTTADKIERPQSSLDREMFQDANIRLNKAGGGMLVQPSVDGSRPGYAGKKGFVKPLSPELQKLFNKTNPGEEWGKGKFADHRARGNWKNDAPRKQKILNATSNLITEDQLAKILTEELGEEITRAKIFGKYGVGKRTKFAETIDNLLFKGKFGSIKGGKDAGGSVRYFKKPSKNDIKKILKSETLGDVRINTLKANTVKNILYLNKKYGDIYKAGNIPDIELVMKGTSMTEQSAGTATARLAQIYNGHKFNNKELKGIRVNTKTASKMFEIMDKSPFGNPYRNSLYKVSLATIDQKLGNEIGTFEGLKKKATKILKDNKIPIYDFKKGDKAFGFNINEIAGVTGSAKSKAAEFSQFIDVMEGNLNQKTLANFQGQLSIARQNIENNPAMLSSESKRINKLARNLEGQYDIELPRLKDPDATKYFSPQRIRELNAQGIDVVKAAERAGYTVQMPKSAVTVQEFVKQTPKAVQGLSAFMKKLGIKCQLANGINCNMPQAYEKSLNQLSKASYAGDSAAAAKMTNFAKSVRGAGSIVKGVLGPAALAWEVGIGVPLGLFEYAQGKPTDEIVNSLTYGLAGKDRETKMKEIFPEYGQGDALDTTYKGFLSTLNPLGEIRDPESLRPGKQITMKDVMEKAQPFMKQTVPPSLGFKEFDLDMFRKNIDESRAVEQKLAEQDLERKEQRTTDPFTAYSDDFMAAGGGIAGLSGGIDQGPQRRSMNPDSGGLKALVNRVKKQ